jgi:hypothetical protein
MCKQLDKEENFPTFGFGKYIYWMFLYTSELMWKRFNNVVSTRKLT